MESFECAFDPMTLVIEPPFQMLQGVVSSFFGAQRASMAEDLLKHVLVMLLILHRVEFINLRAVFGCSREGERFQAHQIDNVIFQIKTPYSGVHLHKHPTGGTTA
jgi:hypothetical protein